MNNYLKSNIQSGAVILFLSTIFVKIIGAFFKIPLSSNAVLGDLGFGYFSAAYDLFTPISTLAVAGFPLAISKLVSEFMAENKGGLVKKIFNYSRKILCFYALIFTLLIILAIFLLNIFDDKSKDGIYAYLCLVPSVFFCFLASAYRGYYEGVNNMKIPAISNIIEALCKFFLGLGFAIIMRSWVDSLALCAAAAMFGITVGTFFSLIYLHLAFVKNSSVQKSNLNDNTDIEGIFKTSLAIFLIQIAASSLSGSVVALIDSITVRWQLGAISEQNSGLLFALYDNAILDYAKISGASLLEREIPTFLYGIKSKAFTLYNLVPTLTVSIGIGAVPVISALFSKGDTDNLKKNISSVIKLCSVITFPIGLGYVFLGRGIMKLLYGSSGSSVIGGDMLTIYGFAAILAAFSAVLTCLLQSIGKQKEALIGIIIGLLIKLILNLLLTPLPCVNIFGAVYSTLICYVVIFIFDFILILKNIGFDFDILKSIFKPLFSGLICGLSALIISNFSSGRYINILSIFVAGVVYIVVLLLFKTFNEDDISALPMGKRLVFLCKKVKIL